MATMWAAPAVSCQPFPTGISTSSFSSRRRSCFFGTSAGFRRKLSSLALALEPRAMTMTMTRVVVVAAAAKEEDAAKKAPKKKMPSAVKRARLSEQRRIYNKSRKSEIRTRMKKVFVALDALKKKPAASPEELTPVEAMIGEAYSVIDKAVKVHTLHRNTGRRRKSRLARAKKTVEIALGWYTPAAPEAAAAN